jgi:competence protein ComEC
VPGAGPLDAPTRRPVPQSRVWAWACVVAAAIGVIAATRASTVLADAGAWAGVLNRGSVWFALASASVGFALVLGVRRAAWAAVLTSVVLSSVGWTVLRTRDLPPDSLVRSTLARGPIEAPPLVRLEGIVRTVPEPVVSQEGVLDHHLARPAGSVFDLDARVVVDDAGERPVSGLVRVRVTGERVSVRVGDAVRVTGLWFGPQAPAHAGQRDARLWAAMDGRAGTIALPDTELIEPAQHVTPGWIDRVRAAGVAVRERVRSVVHPPGAEDGVGRGLLLGLVLGEADGPEMTSTRDSFARLGAAHLLAISGFHLTLLAFGALTVVRLTGDHGRWDVWVVVAMIALYLVLVPARVPVVRAAALTLAVLLAEAGGRRADRLTVLGWVTVALILWRPLDVFALGAQLSVGITALLVWLGERRPAWLVGSRWLRHVETPREPAWRLTLGWVRTAFMTAVAAWMVAAPLVAWHTGNVSVIGPVAVLLLTPGVVVVLALGLLSAVLGLGAPAVGVAVADAASVFAGWVASGAAWLQALPLVAFEIPRLSIWAAAVGTLATVHACRCARLRSVAAWGPVLAAAVWIAVEAHAASRLPGGVTLRVDAFSVGDGTCIVVRSERDALLWDAGSLTPGLGVRVLPRAMRGAGVGAIDRAVLTHANVDHFVFAPDVARDLTTLHVGPRTLEVLRSSDAGRELLAWCDVNGVGIETIARGSMFSLGSARATVLWPPRDESALARPLVENDRSVVVRLDVSTRGGDRSIVLSGDIQRAAIARLLERPDEIRADVIELPHHGGWHDAAPVFVEAAGATVVLQSTGVRRARASRSAETWGPQRQALEAGGGAWWVTAEDGSAWVEVLEDGRIRTGSARR